jgi:hypothetical protein
MEATKPAAPTSTTPAAVWTNYRVTWNFITSICASVPADPALVQKWLEARQPKVKPAGALSIQEINEEVVASLERGEGEPEQDYSLLVFQRHQGALCMRHGTVKAHIKDCARVLSAQFIGKIEGERAFSTRVINGVYPDPKTYWIPLLRDGQPITQADGERDKAVHMFVPGRGQMSALKRLEYIEPPCSLTFMLKVLGRTVSNTDLRTLFEYGGVHGYAGERSDGEGRYEFELTKIE